MGHVLKKWQHKVGGGWAGVLIEVIVYSWSLLRSCSNSLFVPFLASLDLGQSPSAKWVHQSNQVSQSFLKVGESSIC